MPETSVNQPSSPEMPRSTELAILLDVDGVVTDPTEKKVVEPQIFDLISNQLKIGNPVALNTGRSNEWMIERVINPLNARIADKSILKNFFAIGEKGLTWTSFDASGKLIQGVFNREGTPVEGFDLSVFLDPATVEHFKTLEREARSLIETKYKHSTFFDASKKAMVSTEMFDKFDQPTYAKEQVQFTQELHDMLKRLGLEGKFKIDPTTIATDIQVPTAGKHLGTKRILDWLTRHKIAPKHFVAVGDSASDLEMADELKTQGKNYTFRYLNPEKPLPADKIMDHDKKPKYNLVVSKAPFSKGLVEVFGNLKAA